MAGIRKNNKTVKRERQRNITKKAGIERHQYYTRMNYDGRTLSVESKQDNRPIRRKKYTLKQLRREIPIAAKLIEKYLGGNVPQSLHNHSHPHHAVSIYPVLPNPVDLGLLPPGRAMPAIPASSQHTHIGHEFSPISMTSDCSPSTCERGRKHHVAAYDDNDNDNDNDDNDNDILKLFIRDLDDRDNRRIRIQ